MCEERKKRGNTCFDQDTHSIQSLDRGTALQLSGHRTGPYTDTFSTTLTFTETPGALWNVSNDTFSLSIPLVWSGSLSPANSPSGSGRR